MPTAWLGLKVHSKIPFLWSYGPLIARKLLLVTLHMESYGISVSICFRFKISFHFFLKSTHAELYAQIYKLYYRAEGQIWGKRYTHMGTGMTATNSLTLPMGQTIYTVRSDLSFLCGLWNLDQELFLFRVGGVLCKLSQNMCAWRSLNVHIVRQRCAIRTRARKRMLLACLLCKGKSNTIIRVFTVSDVKHVEVCLSDAHVIQNKNKSERPKTPCYISEWQPKIFTCFKQPTSINQQTVDLKFNLTRFVICLAKTYHWLLK